MRVKIKEISRNDAWVEYSKQIVGIVGRWEGRYWHDSEYSFGTFFPENDITDTSILKDDPLTFYEIKVEILDEH